MKLVPALAFITLVFSSCLSNQFYVGKTFAGGEYVPPRELNLGRRLYTEYCISCHGVKGDGKGVAALGMETPPRDFTLGIIKFSDVMAGDLPHGDSIFQSLEHGLGGTAMLPWDLSRPQQKALWNYIKTFAPDIWEGKDKALGERIVPTPDPFSLARKNAAIKQGRKVYHVTASCQTCHRAYVTAEEYQQMTRELTGDADDIDEEFYKLKIQESDHGYKILPPDFTFHPLRSIRTKSTLSDLYIRIAAGIGGTTMPPWKDSLEEQDIWALAYYLQHLMEMRDNPARHELIQRLEGGGR